MSEGMYVRPSYRNLSRGCCVPTVRSVIGLQFSFKSATETSECHGRVTDSQRQRVPKRRVGSGEAARDPYRASRLRGIVMIAMSS